MLSSTLYYGGYVFRLHCFIFYFFFEFWNFWYPDVSTTGRGRFLGFELDGAVEYVPAGRGCTIRCIGAASARRIRKQILTVLCIYHYFEMGPQGTRTSTIHVPCTPDIRGK